MPSFGLKSPVRVRVRVRVRLRVRVRVRARVSVRVRVRFMVFWLDKSSHSREHAQKAALAPDLV